MSTILSSWYYCKFKNRFLDNKLYHMGSKLIYAHLPKGLVIQKIISSPEYVAA